MKAILEFNLPEEREQFDDACNGWKWGVAIWHFDQYLRSHIKHSADDTPEAEYQAYVAIREKLYQVLNENELTLK